MTTLKELRAALDGMCGRYPYSNETARACWASGAWFRVDHPTALGPTIVRAMWASPQGASATLTASGGAFGVSLESGLNVPGSSNDRECCEAFLIGFLGLKEAVQA